MSSTDFTHERIPDNEGAPRRSFTTPLSHLTGEHQTRRNDLSSMNPTNSSSSDQPDPAAGTQHGEAAESEMDLLRSELSEARSRIAELETELSRLAQAGQTTDDSSLLLDGDSKLYSEAYFTVALDARVAAAKRHLRPVAVALLEFSEGNGSNRAPAPAGRGAEAIRQTLRDADTACRLKDGTFALILEDTPENGAVWTVERVRRNLVSRFGTHTMWAGVACYPAHAFSADELVSQSREALSSAKDWNQDRIEVAIAE